MVTYYRDWAPTPFDVKGLGCAGQQDWLVAPVLVTRDTVDAITLSNFAAIKAILTAEGIEYDTPIFNHWGPGWIEIILVHPSGETVLQGVEERLSDYPVLDEGLMSQIECDAETDSWDNWAEHDFKRQLANATGREPGEAFNPYRLFRIACEKANLYVEHDSEGARFPISKAVEWIIRNT